MNAIFHVIQSLLVLPIVVLLIISLGLSYVAQFIALFCALAEAWVVRAFPTHNPEPEDKD